MHRLERVLLEPVNTLTHLAGAIFALAGMLVLMGLTRNEPGKMLSMLVYGISLVGLFLASALFHGVRGRAPLRMWLNRLDHAAIFLLIAGTYTPILHNLYPGNWGPLVLTFVWAAALIGVAVKMSSRRIHGMLNVSVYLALGWGGVVPLVLALSLATVLALPGLEWLFAGGLIYSVGFVIYYRRWPDPWPDVFGYHEIWHLFVLAGGLCHYLFILWYVVPAA